jgi:hypothetical protein
MVQDSPHAKWSTKIKRTYESLETSGNDFRVFDDSSQTSYDKEHGIRALDDNGQPFTPELPGEDPRDTADSLSPFPGVTDSDIVSHVLKWLTGFRNSKLISTTDDLDWALWEALRRMLRNGSRIVTIFVILIPDHLRTSIIRARALPLLKRMSGSDVKKAIPFSLWSSEHLYYLQIPSECVVWHQSFTLQVSI